MPKKKWCRFRKKCREGLDCTYGHPEEELQYFRELEEEEDQRYEDKPRYETPHKVPRPQKLQQAENRGQKWTEEQRPRGP